MRRRGGGVMMFEITSVKTPELNPLFRGFRTCHHNSTDLNIFERFRRPTHGGCRHEGQGKTR